MSRHGIGAENPINDSGQVVFASIFLIIWGIGSFLLHYTVNLSGLTSLFASVPIGVISFIVGVYFVRESAAVVFSNNAGKVIDTGVYGRVRHPIYLGELLILSGFSIVTLSILSFIVCIAFFIFIDKMAAYEEKDLIRILGEQYSDYKERVRKW